MFSAGIILGVKKTVHFHNSLTGWRLLHALYLCVCAVIYLGQGMFTAVLPLTSQWV